MRRHALAFYIRISHLLCCSEQDKQADEAPPKIVEKLRNNDKLKSVVDKHFFLKDQIS